MKKNTLLLYTILFTSIFIACEKDDSNHVPKPLQAKNFVWKGLNQYYLWQEDVEDLADDRFANQYQLNDYLANFESPNSLFNHLKLNNQTDRFSVIYNDYSVLEGVLSGTLNNNGVDFALRENPQNTNEVFGWVRYILPNSDASTKNIKRGDIFYAVNGITLTKSNYNNLLASNTYTLSLANYVNDAIVPTGETVSLTKTNRAENPIYSNQVFNFGDKKIGYLMYNGFYAQYDNQLNTVFGNFQSQGVTDLILDLRYNSGGSVNTATKLASMITGQFTNQIFAQQQWNAKAQDYFETRDPNSLLNKFAGNLNSLRLSKVYILTSKSSASASELVINGLKSYIDVVQIGDVTTGKNVGSITLYDSPSFSKNDVNKTHKYAMQPIVLKIANKDGFGDYQNGLTPNLTFIENLENLGVLGTTSEPFLNFAIQSIINSGKKPLPKNQTIIRDLIDSKALNPLRTEMYVELK
jgi:carboxyl-terminal processing protease